MFNFHITGLSSKLLRFQSARTPIQNHFQFIHLIHNLQNNGGQVPAMRVEASASSVENLQIVSEMYRDSKIWICAAPIVADYTPLALC